MVIFCDWVSCIPGWPQAHYIAKDDDESLILLPVCFPSAEIKGECQHYLVDKSVF